jgi:DNA gyrase subunit A
LVELGGLYASPRRTLIEAASQTLSYNEDAYIVSEETWVVVTRSGWIKRQNSFTELSKIRVREEDEIGWLVQANTRSTLAFFGSNGGSYVLRVDDVPATTGYGEPLQRRFAFADGERVVGVVSHDERHTRPAEAPEDDPRPHTGIALTCQGRVLRFTLAVHATTSKRAGRKYARLREGDQVFAVYPVQDSDQICIATKLGRALTFPCVEVPCLRAAGKGVTGVKLREEDVVFASGVSQHPGSGPKVATSFGRDEVIRPRKFEGKRGGRGKVLLKRGSINEWEMEPEIVSVEALESSVTKANEPKEAPVSDPSEPNPPTTAEAAPEVVPAESKAEEPEPPPALKAVPEKPAPEKPAPEKPAPEKAVPEKAAPKKRLDLSNAPLFANTQPPDDVPTDVGDDEEGED